MQGGAIWLTANGDIYYRFSSLGKIHTASIAKINLVFSSFLNCNFQINKNDLEEIKKSIHKNELTISIGQLLLVEAEKFSPYEKEGLTNPICQIKLFTPDIGKLNE